MNYIINYHKIYLILLVRYQNTPNIRLNLLYQNNFLLRIQKFNEKYNHITL